MQNSDISAILLSAGTGSRLKNTVPKQFLLLRGKPIIVYSIEKILSFDSVKELIITFKDDQKQRLNDIISNYVPIDKKKIIKIVKGGATRQESVMNAIKHSSYQTLLLHESARPLASIKLFKNVIENEAEAVTSGIDIPFTVLECRNNKMTGILKRDQIFNVQLPQKFNRDKLIEAHKIAKNLHKEYTDDSSLYFDAGFTVDIVKGEHDNIKVTNPKDIIIAERLLEDIYE
ncbi:MAG: 2-C-methyl-D-erythritol 4-phosphate cytidylyltransferase [Spirochaetales bacterium]|nr:2-C-methyl-D-erythritol 4-phosphate cytidylyltransferase [Spirochaetales bacterium]